MFQIVGFSLSGACNREMDLCSFVSLRLKGASRRILAVSWTILKEVVVPFSLI
jgi:hypothetical protein